MKPTVVARLERAEWWVGTHPALVVRTKPRALPGPLTRRFRAGNGACEQVTYGMLEPAIDTRPRNAGLKPGLRLSPTAFTTYRQKTRVRDVTDRYRPGRTGDWAGEWCIRARALRLVTHLFQRLNAVFQVSNTILQRCVISPSLIDKPRKIAHCF